MSSLYERIGGQEAILAAVDVFYRRVLADRLTRPFFEGVDMRVQAKKQIGFMAHAFGGPEEFKGRDLRTAHALLVKERGLSAAHFDAVAGHLQATRQELDVTEDLVDEVLAVVSTTREAVLGE